MQSAEPTAAIVPSYDPRDPYAIRDGVATRWLTKDKRSYLISEMEDRHLLNTVRFLERQLLARHAAAETAVAAETVLGSTLASYRAEVARAMFGSYAMEAHPILKGLRAELRRRGLPELVP